MVRFSDDVVVLGRKKAALLRDAGLLQSDGTGLEEQIRVLSQRIESATQGFRAAGRRDNNACRTIVRMVGHRAQLLSALEQENPDRHNVVLENLSESGAFGIRR